jgi:polyhydroxybutyrate depolymerase
MLTLASSHCVTNERLFDDSAHAEDIATPSEPIRSPSLESSAVVDGDSTGDERLDARPEGPSSTSLEPPASAPESSPGAVVDETAAGCTAGSVGPGDWEFELLHAGQPRRYFVHVPDGYDTTKPVPLVVDLHGMTSTAREQTELSGWREKSDAVGFIVAYPEGLDGSWNGGELCCGRSMLDDIDDEGFIRAVVRRLQDDACVDAKRIYATGLSSGGAMAHLLACRAADIFAATAPVSMGNGTTPCEPSRPISVVMTRGTLDLVARFDGISPFPGAEEDFDQWRDLNGCIGAPQLGRDFCESYRNCAGGVEVVTCSVLGQHVLYDNIADFSVPDAAWAVFERHAIP